jgi:hypothetical protein
MDSGVRHLSTSFACRSSVNITDVQTLVKKSIESHQHLHSSRAVQRKMMNMMNIDEHGILDFDSMQLDISAPWDDPYHRGGIL